MDSSILNSTEPTSFEVLSQTYKLEIADVVDYTIKYIKAGKVPLARYTRILFEKKNMGMVCIFGYKRRRDGPAWFLECFMQRKL